MLEVLEAYHKTKMKVIEKDIEIKKLEKQLYDSNKALEDTYKKEDLATLFSIYTDSIFIKDSNTLLAWFKGTIPFPKDTSNDS